MKISGPNTHRDNSFETPAQRKVEGRNARLRELTRYIFDGVVAPTDAMIDGGKDAHRDSPIPHGAR